MPAVATPIGARGARGRAGGFGEQIDRRRTTYQFNGEFAKSAADLDPEKPRIEGGCALQVIDIDVDEDRWGHTRTLTS
jgi:hypothetical protein